MPNPFTALMWKTQKTIFVDFIVSFLVMAQIGDSFERFVTWVTLVRFSI